MESDYEQRKREIEQQMEEMRGHFAENDRILRRAVRSTTRWQRVFGIWAGLLVMTFATALIGGLCYWYLHDIVEVL